MSIGRASASGESGQAPTYGRPAPLETGERDIHRFSPHEEMAEATLNFGIHKGHIMDWTIPFEVADDFHPVMWAFVRGGYATREATGFLRSRKMTPLMSLHGFWTAEGIHPSDLRDSDQDEAQLDAAANPARQSSGAERGRAHRPENRCINQFSNCPAKKVINRPLLSRKPVGSWIKIGSERLRNPSPLRGPLRGPTASGRRTLRSSDRAPP